MANRLASPSVDIQMRLYARGTKLPEVLHSLKWKGWKVLCTSANRGYCNYLRKEITIPEWAVSRGREYSNWYLAHELSHALTFDEGFRKEHHGPNFMRNLILICPTESLHLETTYKPRNAQSAGISKYECFNQMNANNGVLPVDAIPDDF